MCSQLKNPAGILSNFNPILGNSILSNPHSIILATQLYRAIRRGGLLCRQLFLTFKHRMGPGKMHQQSFSYIRPTLLILRQ